MSEFVYAPQDSAPLDVTRRRWIALGFLGVLHAVALATMLRTEYGMFAIALFLLTWAGLNLLLIALCGRPAVAGIVALMLVELVVAASKFKFDITWMTANFLDVMVIDHDTLAFLFGLFPNLALISQIAALLVAVALVLAFRLDPVRMRRGLASFGGIACLGAAIGLSTAVPEQPWEPFQGVNHISNFVRSGVVSMTEFMLSGFLDADAPTSEKLRAPAAQCQARGKPPHIIMVLDESSFNISDAPGVTVPPGYGDHFRSRDGRMRSLMVESTGGSTWLAEYGALTGLSARSFGRMKFYVTRIAAGRVTRGLPNVLQRCGYKTFTFYPAYGAFLSARAFQATTGIQRFMDTKDMGASDAEPDHFFYNRALRTFAAERGDKPLFMFVYTVANHFPWDVQFRPELTPDWRAPGNSPIVDEYLRRQSASAADYRSFLDTLKRQYPDESFLIVRFGDHGPNFGPRALDPALEDGELNARIAAYHPRYFTTYYVIDALNYEPADTSSARDMVEIAYLPLIVQEAAGLPLDPSFEEQKAILGRCQGLFYRCRGGAEARRFNRLLIDAGLIKGF